MLSIVVGPGSVLASKYKLVRLLGEGGMGSVYEATHLVLGTRVAVKVLHQDLARRAGLIDRFLQEAMVSARIRSENVVHVLDVERTPEGVAFMVMELLEGEPLSAVLDRIRRLEEPMACEYARQILCALEAAHALGVVHRDLKPENVFVTYVGERPVLKLIDFGIAKLRRTEVGAKNLTVAGVLMGTAEYMAPEQAYSADSVDARADLYAVAVMLYEMLAGSRPVAGDDGRIIALKIERGEVVPLVHALPAVKPELAGLVHRAMAFRRDLRFASATEMRIALEAIRAVRPGAVPADRAGELAAKAGTGTMMGAPIEAVLGAAHRSVEPTTKHADPPPGSPGSGTIVGALQSAGAAEASAYGSPPEPYPPRFVGAPVQPPRRRRSSALVIGLVLASLLLGAGIAAAIVLSSGDGATALPVVPLSPIPTSATPGTVADTHPTVLTPPLTPTPTLVPQTPTTAAPTRPTSSPSVAPSSSSPVPAMPTIVLPPMPSTFPSFQVPPGWPSVPVFPGFPVPPSPVSPSPSSGY
jgi:eukaryotic-like serine/threonine-protein kinase